MSPSRQLSAFIEARGIMFVGKDGGSMIFEAVLRGRVEEVGEPGQSSP
jgi:hypothetical protein